MKIIYIHGFNSGPNTETGNKIKEQYPNTIIANYDFKNAYNARKDLDKIIKDNIKEDILLVGSSLGGFWSNYMSEIYKLPCILINPATNPTLSLFKYLGTNTNYSTNLKYEFTNYDFASYHNFSLVKSNLFKIIILSKNDTVLDYKIAEKFYKNYKIYYNNDGHSLKDYTLLYKCIEEYNNYLCHLYNNCDDTTVKENYKNLFDTEEKQKYADEVWDLIQNSYKPIGGIKGNGFKNKEDMINNISFWKLYIKDNKIIAVILYKDKNGRKSVAGGTDGSADGKKQFIKMKQDDLLLKRSYSEVSDKVLSNIYRNTPDFINYVIPFNDVVSILNVPIKKPTSNDVYLLKYPELKDYFYMREINDEWITKIMIGTPNKKII